jgi:transcriptional regulator with XRE-family HTH domain
VNAYLGKHPGLTLNALAGRSGVAATTLRRLMQEGHRQELAPHTVLSLASYLLKEKNISILLKKVDGPVAELLNRSFDQFIFDEKSSHHKMEQELNSLFQDKTTYLIYKLAANVCGTSALEIKNLFGLLGLEKLNDLIEKNWILADETDTEILHAREKNFTVDISLAQSLTHSLVDLYKPRDIDKGLNLFYSLSEGMSVEGIKQIKEIEKSAVKKIFDLMNDKKYQGNIPYYAIILSDILGLTPHQESTTGVLQ